MDKANESILDAFEKSLDLVESLSDAEDVALAWPLLNTIADQERLAQDAIFTELDQILATYSPGLCNSIKAEKVQRQATPVNWAT